MDCAIFVAVTKAGRGGLVVNTSDSGSRGRGFEPHSGRGVVSLSKTYLPPQVLVIPRKRWLRPNMTENLFTRTLSIKPNQKTKSNKGPDQLQFSNDAAHIMIPCHPNNK